ncbi:hypothetical protein ACWIUD_06780 [Helicobacter sp. 23-1044]
MKLKVLLFCIFMASAAAEQFGGFLEFVYDEASKLHLNKSQQIALNEIIKNHHNFLRQWYVDMKKNNEQILQKFTTSNLPHSAIEFTHGRQLSAERIDAEYKFILEVYEMLDETQRKAFREKMGR